MKMSKIPYAEEIIRNFPEEVVISTATTPATEHLFWVRNQQEVKHLPKEQAISS